MEKEGKRWKIVWQDGEIQKAREGYDYELITDNQPYLIRFYMDNREPLLISTLHLICLEPVLIKKPRPNEG